jgi:two-component system, LuxR family, sensor kinase FixL
LRTMSIEDLTALPRRTATELRQQARQEGRTQETFPHRLASGALRTVEVHSSPVQVKGRPLLFSIIHDITERKMLEREILDISETERQRIGRDLHDSLGGMLTGAALLSKALAHRLATKATAEAALAEEIVRCINDSIGQARAAAHGLFPVELNAGGLVAGLREFAAETTKRSGIPCRLKAAKGLLISDASVASHLFRIVQEAVNNAIRHGEARHVSIHLGRTGDQIRLEIRDDGKGLPARQVVGRGLGLRTMKYRAGIIGARFALESANGHGTVVSCLVPLRKPLLPKSG